MRICVIPVELCDISLIFVITSQCQCVMFLFQASLMGTDDISRNFNKLEKADILELAVEQLQMLQKQNDDNGSLTF